MSVFGDQRDLELLYITISFNWYTHLFAKILTFITAVATQVDDGDT